MHAAARHAVLVKATRTCAADALLVMLSLSEAAIGSTAATEKIKLAVPCFKRRTQASRWAASEGHAGSAACPDAIEDMYIDAEQSSPSETLALVIPADVHLIEWEAVVLEGLCRPRIIITSSLQSDSVCVQLSLCLCTACTLLAYKSLCNACLFLHHGGC